MASEGEGDGGGQQLESVLEEAYGGGEVSEYWLEKCGDHIHHGYYENQLHLDSDSALDDDLAILAQKAAVRLIDKLLLWANIPDGGGPGPKKILDVGMGLGAVSRYLGNRFPQASVQGISLVKYEVETATKITASQNLSDKVSFLVADARKLPFPDNEYDLVVCLECADHISEREQLMKELARVTTPGGQIVLTTICNRELLPHETSLSESEKETLQIICNGFAIAPCSPTSLYVKLAQEYGLQAIQSDNWTKYVAPGVPIWIHFQQNVNFSEHIVKDHLMTFSTLMKAYEQGLAEYFVLAGVKPSP